ncbi:hypothetical protein SAMN05443247_03241 [Bradyrhizobium erythrophlei]|nr:hypothetical protein SAMN05443247_03241 [Bradyrhizobium erythrophlei]
MRSFLSAALAIALQQTIRAARALRAIGAGAFGLAKLGLKSQSRRLAPIYRRVSRKTIRAGRALRAVGPAVIALTKRGLKAGPRRLALIYRRMILIRYRLETGLATLGRVAVGATLAAFIIVGFVLAHVFQTAVEAYFNPERFTLLRNLLATTGGALVGATAIGFSVVMIAVQLNFARMPHGLFRKLSSDFRLLGTFAATFLLAIGVSALSLVPDASWSALASIGATWATLLILILFFYGYQRALDLINPVVQLRLIVATAQKDLRQWARRSQRMAPLLNVPAADEANHDRHSKHDLARMAFFRANPIWTSVARRAVSHAISFARRYSEQGDFEVSGGALQAVVLINASYVAAKGRTFFASNPIFDIPESSDGFINSTLEHLRRFEQISTARGEEDAIRQILIAIAKLVQTYVEIDYAVRHTGTKEHAQLAASYLTGAVERVLPRNLPDVVMEGIRLMGASAGLFLTVGQPNDITILVEKITAFSIAGVVKPADRVLVMTGIEQLAQLTFDLLRTQTHDIDFAAKQLRDSVEFVVKIFLTTVPDAPLDRVHSNYLSPYYSLTKTRTLGDKLTELCNALIDTKENDEAAKGVLSNIQTWSEELYRTEKTLLLLAIAKKSHFTFDSLHWIAHVTKLLTALARAPIVDDHMRDELEKNANWLISVISWIPEDKESTQFVESFSMIELLFEAARDAIDSPLVLKSTRDLLIGWAFKAGRHETGWGTLGQAMIALVTFVLWKEDLPLTPWLKAETAKRLSGEGAPKQEIRDRAAHDLRRTATSLRRREFETNRVRHAMNQIEPTKVRTLLTEIADILSPDTAGEPVSSDLF